jgi:maltooligosyltrehalose synthase
MPIRTTGGRSKKRTTRKAANKNAGKVTSPLGNMASYMEYLGARGLTDKDMEILQKILKKTPKKKTSARPAGSPAARSIGRTARTPKTARAGTARGARRGSGRR